MFVRLPRRWNQIHDVVMQAHSDLLFDSSPSDSNIFSLQYTIKCCHCHKCHKVTLAPYASKVWTMRYSTFLRVARAPGSPSNILVLSCNISLSFHYPLNQVNHLLVMLGQTVHYQVCQQQQHSTLVLMNKTNSLDTITASSVGRSSKPGPESSNTPM